MAKENWISLQQNKLINDQGDKTTAQNRGFSCRQIFEMEQY